jgi:hypothetical protein
MALNWTTIDTAIKVWLDTAAPSVTFYRGDQNIPRPALPVGEWTWSNVGGKLQAQGASYDDDPVVDVAPSSTLRQVIGYRRHQLEVQLFATQTVGTTAPALGQVIADALELNSVTTALAAAGLRILPSGPVLDATALLGYAAESRAVVEFFVYTVESQTEEVGRISTVTPLTGTLTK